MKFLSLPLILCAAVLFSSGDARRHRHRKRLRSAPALVVDPADAKFMVSVYLFAKDHEDKMKLTVCSGVLLNSRYVLTSAQCVGDVKSDNTVNFGQFQKNKNAREIYKDYQAGVDEILIYPGYALPNNEFDYTKDIALLKLDMDVKESDDVAYIKSTDSKIPRAGSKVDVFGYGYMDRKHDDGTKNAENVMLKTTLDVLGLTEKDARNSRSVFETHRAHPCPGDAGSAMVFGGKLVGLAASSKSRKYQQNCVPGDFGNYLPLAQFNDWITRAINERSE